MNEVITCEVINTEDKKKMTIVTEWLNDEDMKIVLLRSEMAPLIGQTTVTKLYEASKKRKTREEALNEIRNELSGKVEDVEFSIRGTRFVWKKKKIWEKGSVQMEPCDDIATLVNMNILWLGKFSSSQNTSLQCVEENKKYRADIDELTSKIGEMERIKKSMEEILYQKFLLLLNTKKRKIRELEEQLNRQKADNDFNYDAKTDESDVEEPEEKVSRKRLNLENRSSPVASTSKKLCQFSIKSSQESDDEIVLRYDESQTEFTSNLTIEESPEDDIFS